MLQWSMMTKGALWPLISITSTSPILFLTCLLPAIVESASAIPAGSPDGESRTPPQLKRQVDSTAGDIHILRRVVRS